MYPPIESLLPELSREAATTRRVLGCVPAGRLDWRPHPKSLTIVQLDIPMPPVYGPTTHESPFAA